MRAKYPNCYFCHSDQVSGYCIKCKMLDDCILSVRSFHNGVIISCMIDNCCYKAESNFVGCITAISYYNEDYTFDDDPINVVNNLKINPSNVKQKIKMFITYE